MHSRPQERPGPPAPSPDTFLARPSDSLAERDEVLDRLRDARFSDGVFCPRCGHREVRRWGSFSGRQRYHCKGCRRTFSDLTGTPAAYLKKIELLPAYCDGLAAQLSIRYSAERLGIDPSTAFRWRHRLLDWLRRRDTETVAGWVELGSFWLPESHKGRRDIEHRLGRPPRRRGGPGRWNPFHEGSRQHVAVACDRAGRVVSGPCPYLTSGPLTTWGLEAVLAGRFEHVELLKLTATGEARRAAIALATRIGATFYDAFLPPGRMSTWMRGGRSRILPRSGDRSLVHVRTVVAYIRRLRAWLRYFRGVATRYLLNYLFWHRLADLDTRSRFQSLMLRWARPPGLAI